MGKDEVLGVHEEGLIRAFIRPERRARLRELLGSAKGRVKLRRALAHFADLDPRYALPIPPSNHQARDIESILRSKGAPDTCHVLAEAAELDGREMKLISALEAIVGRGMGALVSCVPGKLGYFE